MVTPADALRLGDLAVEGRLVVASNLTVLATATLNGTTTRCVYKPISGERPLWDFPDGTLAAREVAAYTVSDALGWDLVPVTVMRADGPLGAGMCQVWIEQEEDLPPWVDIVDPDAVRDGVLPVLRAVDGDGAPVVVVHRDDPHLRKLALFDAVVNNADRKGGHILHGRTHDDGERGVLGVDHGVSFHVEPKLRTVLWGWAGERLDSTEHADLARLRAGLERDAPVHHALSALLDEAEVEATADRVDTLLAAGVMPHPAGRMPVPWPVL